MEAKMQKMASTLKKRYASELLRGSIELVSHHTSKIPGVVVKINPVSKFNGNKRHRDKVSVELRQEGFVRAGKGIYCCYDC